MYISESNVITCVYWILRSLNNKKFVIQSQKNENLIKLLFVSMIFGMSFHDFWNFFIQNLFVLNVHAKQRKELVYQATVHFYLL